MREWRVSGPIKFNFVITGNEDFRKEKCLLKTCVFLTPLALRIKPTRKDQVKNGTFEI